MKKLLFLIPTFIFASCDMSPEQKPAFLDSDGIPIPTHSYVNDFSGKMLDSTQINALNHELRAYEDSTTNQIVVICLPKLPENSSGGTWTIGELATPTFRKWAIGQKDKNNGVLFLISLEDRKNNIQPGYGLEGALPDITCKRILDDDVEPLFKDEKYHEGIVKAISRIQRAIAGEYEADLKKESAESMFFIRLGIGILICGIISAFVWKFGGILGGLYGAIYWYIASGHHFLFSLLIFLAAAIIAIIIGAILRAGVSGELGSSGGSSDGGGGFFGGGGSSGGAGASGSW